LRPAVFLDRDGVLIEHVPYISHAEDVRLVEGAAAAIVALRHAGYACVVVSNQSGIGRGLITEAQVVAVNERMCWLFAAAGAVFDALYHCPVAPRSTDPTIVEHEDRKPGPGMLRRAASELRLDLTRSWIIGDSISDVLAGINAGCRGSILIEGGLAKGNLLRLGAIQYRTAPSLEAAATIVTGQGHCR
jgi:D-glycero-D-manno-heptose 1,7-bisphosphate phosphatase